MRFGATDFREIGAKNFWHCFWHQFGTKMIFAEKSIEDILSSASPQISFRPYWIFYAKIIKTLPTLSMQIVEE